MAESQATSQVTNGILCSDSARYQVIDWIGEGGFATVAKCLNLATGNGVAVKVPKKDNEDILKGEVAILKAVQVLDLDKKNIVKFMEYFRFQELSCLVFEMLDKSIWDLMKERKWAPLSLNEIRTITQQVLVAFDALKGLGIIYCDLKLDNIMLVDHSKQPLKIKLIDFGLALLESKVKLGMNVQLLDYRAPEVILGLPLTTAIDMWSLGCNLAHMYFGRPLFPHNCEYNWMKVMLSLLEQPDPRLLAAGGYTRVFFTWEKGQNNRGMRFNTPEEYKKQTGEMPQVSKKFFHTGKSLEEAVLKGSRKSSVAEIKDQIAFLCLLKCCLTVDACRRITPWQALDQSFITMSHVQGKSETTSHHNGATLSNVDPQLGLSPAPFYRQDLQPNRPSGENSNRPQSCHAADANETSCEKQSDPETAFGYESQAYTASDEKYLSSQPTLLKPIDKSDVEKMSIHLGQEQPHSDTRTNPDESRRKTFSKTVRQFFIRKWKKLCTLCICGASQTE